MGYKQIDMEGRISGCTNKTLETLENPYLKLLERIVDSNNTVLKMNQQIFETVQGMKQLPTFIIRES